MQAIRGFRVTTVDMGTRVKNYLEECYSEEILDISVTSDDDSSDVIMEIKVDATGEFAKAFPCNEGICRLESWHCLFFSIVEPAFKLQDSYMIQETDEEYFLLENM